MARPKAPGKAGTEKRRELEEQERQLAANAGPGAPPPRSGEDQAQQQQQQALTFMQRDFGLDRRLMKAVAKMGFVYPTLVQNKCIPLALKGKDLLVSRGTARQGSGFTDKAGISPSSQVHARGGISANALLLTGHASTHRILLFVFKV